MSYNDFQGLQRAVTHVLAGTANANSPATEIVNRALNMLVKVRPWRWRQKAMSLSFTSLTPSSLVRASNVVTATVAGHGLTSGASIRVTGSTGTTNAFDGSFTVVSIVDANTFTYAQAGANETATAPGTIILGYCVLPADFSAMIALKSAVNSFREVRATSLDDLLERRQFAYGANYETWYALSYLGQTSLTTEPTAILELFPVPVSAVVGALQGFYYRRVPNLNNATDLPDIPGEFHELLRVLCRALALSTEEDQLGTDWQLYQRMLAEFDADDGAAQGVVIGRMTSTIHRGQRISQFYPNGRVRA